MLDFILRYKYLLALLAFWYLVGSISAVAFVPIGFISILLMWRKAMYFEILLGFFFILMLSDSLSYHTDFAKIFKNIYVVLLALIALLDRKKLAASNRIFKYFVPFIAVSIIGLVSSPDMFTSFQKTLSYALILITVPIFLVHAFKNRGPVVIKDLIMLGTLMILIGFSMRLISPGVAYSHGGRFRALFGNPNGLGVFATLLMAFVLVAREYFQSLFSKADLRWIIIPLLIAVVLSGSRTAIVAISLFYLFTRFYKISPFIGFLGFAVAAVLVELVSVNLVSIVQAFGLSEFFRVESLQGGSGRSIAWIFAWENIQEFYWFGRGFAFDEWLMSSNQDMLNDLGHQGGVHNTYLIIWLNTGLVGLFLFLRAYFLLFLKGAKNTRFSFPILWMVVFSITLEPWLAASLNPFTIILLCMITLMTEACFQSAQKESNNLNELPDETPVLS